MREIKFRGQQKDTKIWVYGSLIQCAGIWYIYNENESFRMPEDPDFENSFIEIIPETIGQFTGLYDKHGKEIYEGDVVKDNYGEIGSVEWDNEKAWFYISTQNGGCFFDQDTRAYEIIGNIHENPELLEQ